MTKTYLAQSAKKNCRFTGMMLSGILSAILLLAIGCETDSFDHVPPAGMGSLIVDNHTGDKLDVFINGYETNRVSTYNDKAYNLHPGVHRVIIQEHNGRRSYNDDVDIIERRRTIMRVRWYDSYSYAVNVYFDD